MHDQQTGKPLEFATVELLQLPDSLLLQTTITDKKGRFEFKTSDSNHAVRYSFIGYEVKTYSVTNADPLKLFLSTSSTNMEAVTVTAARKAFAANIDRKVYDVAQDLMSASGSASDILRNIPSVEVDIDGNVSLRGAGNLLILVNGRQSQLMSGASQADVLQQFPANSIERIEIITNPGARFRPDGTSGIINIILKKNLKNGFNGTITGTVGNRDRYNGNKNLNFRTGKWNLYATGGLRQDARLRSNTSERIVFDSGKISSRYFENGFMRSRSHSAFISVGFDYELNDRNVISLSGNYSKWRMDAWGPSERKLFDNNAQLLSHFRRDMFSPETEPEKELNFGWDHKFANEDEELSVEFTMSDEEEHDVSRFTTYNFYPARKSLFDNTLVINKDAQQQLIIDYKKPVGDDVEIEIGYAGYFAQQEFDFVIEDYDTINNRFVRNLDKSNLFLYNDANHAFYGTFLRAFEKFGLKAGLRVEDVHLKGRLVTKDSTIRNNYFKFFPTLHLSYKLEKGELQLNYSKRINRPEGDELNPFPEYNDPYNISAGNPYLLPEIIHSIEAGYKWQNNWLTFIPSLYYRYRLNGFTSVTIPLNDSVLLNTEQNFSKDQSTGLELVFSAKKDFFSINSSINFFHNKIDASELGFEDQRSVVSMNGNFNATFTIGKSTMTQLSTNYRSARLTPQGKNYPSFMFNAGIRQDLFQKKMTATLTVSDLFRTQRQKSIRETSYLYQLNRGTRDSQVILFGLSYRFGQGQKKQEERLQFDEEN